MVPRLVQATYLDDYRIHLRFADGTQGEVDLGAELYGELRESAFAHGQPLWVIHAVTWAQSFFADRARRDAEVAVSR